MLKYTLCIVPVIGLRKMRPSHDKVVQLEIRIRWEEKRLFSFWNDALSFVSERWAFAFSPWLVPAYLLPLFQTYWLGRMEKKRFGQRLESPASLVLRTWALGTAVGLLFSLVIDLMNWLVVRQDLIWIWSVTLLLSCLGLRFACLSYSAGILSLASLAAEQLEKIPVSAPWDKLWLSLIQFSELHWLWMAGALHLLEWALIRADGEHGVLPIQMRHRSGRAVCGFLLKKGWPVPLLSVGDGSWLFFPVFLSFARVNVSKPVKQQKRLGSTFVFLYGILLCGLMVLAEKREVVLWVAAFFAVAGHEWIYQWGRWLERRKESLFVSDERGLRVLAVLPDSPAAAMGIKPGHIVQYFNGFRIRTMEDLQNRAAKAAFCKLEVLDERLDRHMMHRILGEEDPGHLGIVGAIPVERSKQEAKQREVT
ncbi:hypothetical protein SAMN05444955_11251 [Lihuaxuella thermophila]|uniref:PDZ domain-containing protein n=1 Tax=Lihuaxuella thermophila TaxID=1173111 RepID=A0A1H8GSD5_9BACL|nr:hypothetical protein SAMN05444955_11251 [Lihuaxuella thermophila]